MSNSPQYEVDNKIESVTLAPSASDFSSQQLAETIAEAADDKKAEEIVLLKVAEISFLADHFVIATGFSTTQVKAICDSIEKEVETKYQLLPLRVQGKSEGRWIAIDYGDAIVHIFMPEEREFYNLEAFWGHAECTRFVANH